MTEVVKKLEHLLKIGFEYISKSSESELAIKKNSKKWSKKEVLGHLIDSGINNLQRFTEIQFVDHPYRLRKYNQDELVIANDYQNAEIAEILGLWVSINNRICVIMMQQTASTLRFHIELDKMNTADLNFLMKDYVAHLEHHLNQIMK